MKAIFLNVSRTVNAMPLINATQGSWVLDEVRASTAKYVCAVSNGNALDYFEIAGTYRNPATGRVEFELRTTTASVKSQLGRVLTPVNKRFITTKYFEW